MSLTLADLNDLLKRCRNVCDTYRLQRLRLMEGEYRKIMTGLSSLADKAGEQKRTSDSLALMAKGAQETAKFLKALYELRLTDAMLVSEIKATFGEAVEAQRHWQDQQKILRDQTASAKNNYGCGKTNGRSI